MGMGIWEYKVGNIVFLKSLFLKNSGEHYCNYIDYATFKGRRPAFLNFTADIFYSFHFPVCFRI